MQLDLEQLAVGEGSPQGPVATCDRAGERPGGNARPAPPPCMLPFATPILDTLVSCVTSRHPRPRLG